MGDDTSRVKGRQEPAFSFSGRAAALYEEPVVELLRVLGAEAGLPVYLTGGVLRNMALGRPPGSDYDVSVAGDAKGFAARLAASLGGSFFVLDRERGTCRVVIKKGVARTIDVSLIRAGGITGDLMTRDFTVNALALPLVLPQGGGLNEPVIDPSGGMADAGRRLLRVVDRGAFDDDPLRVMRGVRIAQLCGLSIEEETWGLIRTKAPLIKESARERVRDELALIFSAPGAAKSVRMFFDVGLIEHIMPELAGWRGLKGYDIVGHTLATLGEAERILDGPLMDEIPLLRGCFAGAGGKGRKGGKGAEGALFLKLAALLHDAGKPATMKRSGDGLSFRGHEVAGEEIAGRLLRNCRFGRRAVREVKTLVRNHHRVFTLACFANPSKRTRAHFFRAVGGEPGLGLLLLALADARATSGREDPALSACVRETADFYFDVYAKRRPAPLMGGGEVMDTFGVGQGPDVGRIMRELDRLVEAGEARTKAGAIRHIKKWLALARKGAAG